MHALSKLIFKNNSINSNLWIRGQCDHRLRWFCLAPTKIGRKIFSTVIGVFYLEIRSENFDFQPIYQLIVQRRTLLSTLPDSKLKSVGIQSENFFSDDRSLLPLDLIEKLRFSTDWVTEHPYYYGYILTENQESGCTNPTHSL